MADIADGLGMLLMGLAVAGAAIVGGPLMLLSEFLLKWADAHRGG